MKTKLNVLIIGDQYNSKTLNKSSEFICEMESRFLVKIGDAIKYLVLSVRVSQSVLLSITDHASMHSLLNNSRGNYNLSSLK